MYETLFSSNSSVHCADWRHRKNYNNGQKMHAYPGFHKGEG